MHIYNRADSHSKTTSTAPSPREQKRMTMTKIEPLEINVQIPYHFRCPISLELMCDPVTVSTGQTYDRTSIESWVATGNTTCPVTRAPLLDFTLIPNHTLRRLIQDWCVANRNFGVERIPTPKQPADANHVKSLLSQISAVSSNYHTRLNSVRRLRGLARDSDKNRNLIASLHVSKFLLPVLFLDSESGGESSELTHESLAIVVMFTMTESECVTLISDPNRITFLVRLLFHELADVRVNSASLIESILVGTRSTELRSEVSNADNVFEGVIEILRSSTQCYPRAMKVGVKALFALSLVKITRHRAVAAGACDVLVSKLAEFEKPDAERALATIELLCRIPSGCQAFASHALTVPLLVKVILKVSDRATEYAAGALLSLCSAAEQCQTEAVRAGVLMQMLLLVQSDCTDRAKRKAQMLLKLLRDSWPDDTIGNNSDDFACSEVVPF